MPRGHVGRPVAAIGVVNVGPGLFSYIWRNSRREQVTILLVVLLSFPFYYLSLDLPKYIVSDALQGRAFPNGTETARLFHIALDLPSWLGGPRTFFEGLQFDRLSYLFVLAALFLLLVLINNVFKYVINMRKGALGERVLQRLRFDLFSVLLSFKPEAMHRLKPSEAATIIKDEVEPIGGFVGDAFVLPAFLGGQALTALAFILIQNLALGLIVMVMVLVQGAVIPRLRREQIRLGRQRQIVSRAFAGKIGEVVETLSEVSNHGTAAVEKSLGRRAAGGAFRHPLPALWPQIRGQGAEQPAGSNHPVSLLCGRRLLRAHRASRSRPARRRDRRLSRSAAAGEGTDRLGSAAPRRRGQVPAGRRAVLAR